MKTRTFQRLAWVTLREVRLDANRLVRLCFISANDQKAMRRTGGPPAPVADLFWRDLCDARDMDWKAVDDVEPKLLDAIVVVAKNT